MTFRRCLSALLIGSTAFAVGADAAEVWKVDSGRTSVHFYDNLLTDLGLRIDQVNETAAAPASFDVQMEGPYVSFEIGLDSDLQYQVNHGRYVPFGVIEGAVRHSGGFTITDVASGASRTPRRLRDRVRRHVHERGARAPASVRAFAMRTAWSSR